MKDLSIIIVNWNTCDLLRQCLRSIIDTSGNLGLELIVIDNGSTDGSSAMVQKEFPSAQLITNTANLGFARANNQGIRVSHGRQILLLNSDTVVHAGALLIDIEDSTHCGCLLSRRGSPRQPVTDGESGLPPCSMPLRNSTKYILPRFPRSRYMISSAPP